MKYIFPSLILFLLMGISQSSFGQSNYTHLKGLLPYPTFNQEEYSELLANSQPKYYSAEGWLLSSSEANLYIKNRYTAQPYVDSAKTEIILYQFMPKKQQLLVGLPVPEFSGVDIHGQQVELSELKGNVVVINFWSTSCKPCLQEIPQLNSLVKKYEQNPNVKFIAFGENTTFEINNFLVEHVFNYRQVPITQAAQSVFGIITLPVNVIIDAQGKVAYFKNMYDPDIYGQMDQKINQLVYQ